MSLDAMREQIKTILTAASGDARVYDYVRLATDYNKLLSLFQTPNGQIKAVMFRRGKLDKRKTTIGGAAAERAHEFKFIAVMGLKDDAASGIAFDAWLDKIERAFDEHDDLNGTCLTTQSLDWGPMAGQAGLQIELIEERMFGNVLCHYAEMRLCALEYES